MIRARLRLPNSEQTVMRQGTALIDACLAQGCVIVNDINNRWPDGLYDAHVEQSEPKANNGSAVKTPPTGEPVGQARTGKRPRIKQGAS